MFAEFTDSWSDDFATLRDARHALLSQSTSGESIKARNAAFCRHLVISIVGSVEYLLQTWRQRDVSNVLGPYFSHPRNTPTKVRLESLLEVD